MENIREQDRYLWATKERELKEHRESFDQDDPIFVTADGEEIELEFTGSGHIPADDFTLTAEQAGRIAEVESAVEEKPRCVCDYLPYVLSPGHTPVCPIHPNGRKLTRRGTGKQRPTHTDPAAS